MRPVFLFLLCCAACTASDPEPPVQTSGFAPDAARSGARLWIEADTRQLTLWAAELGNVLGVAAHVTIDTSHLTPGAGTAHDALGADALTVFEAVAPGDFTLGTARRGLEAGEVAIDAATELAVIPFEIVRAGEVRLAPSRVMVRRADGSYVPTAALGGTLRIAEGDAP
jgi:hypothetical protein